MKAHKSTKCLRMAEGMKTFSMLQTVMTKGGGKTGEIEQVLERLILSWGENPRSKNGLMTKIQSALKRADLRERNIAQEVREWVESTQGHFESTQIHREAHVSTKEGMHAVNAALRRLCEEGIIERFGDKRGAYRRVEKECDSIDWLHAPNQTIDLKWPFGIERYFKTLPKNIIIVAGESDAGKTAFLLNFTRFNMDRHRVHYFSSEMGPIEMKGRISKFDLALEKWTFDARERSSNFADVICPDDVNIIDFLEIHDEFYKIGGFIKEVFDKLKTGVALIALQKNAGTDYGLGGMRGLEKARLYLALNRPTKPNEHNKAKIVKAKNWATESNPNGLCIDFKLVQGCRFTVEKNWYR